MHWFWLRCWFVGTDYQGFRATLASWPPCLITFTGGILNSIGNFLSLWGSCRDQGDASLCPGLVPICLVPPGTHDTMTVVSKYLMSDSYLYAGVLVPTSLSSLAFFPRIFFPVDCFFTILLLTWGFSQFACCLKDCADPPTNFCTSRFPECPQQLCPCPPFLTHKPTSLSHPPAPNTGFGREQNAQFCVKLTVLDFSTRILDPRIIIFSPKL